MTLPTTVADEVHTTTETTENVAETKAEETVANPVAETENEVEFPLEPQTEDWDLLKVQVWTTKDGLYRVIRRTPSDDEPSFKADVNKTTVLGEVKTLELALQLVVDHRSKKLGKDINSNLFAVLEKAESLGYSQVPKVSSPPKKGKKGTKKGDKKMTTATAKKPLKKMLNVPRKTAITLLTAFKAYTSDKHTDKTLAQWLLNIGEAVKKDPENKPDLTPNQQKLLDSILNPPEQGIVVQIISKPGEAPTKSPGKKAPKAAGTPKPKKEGKKRNAFGQAEDSWNYKFVSKITDEFQTLQEICKKSGNPKPITTALAKMKEEGYVLTEKDTTRIKFSAKGLKKIEDFKEGK